MQPCSRKPAKACKFTGSDAARAAAQAGSCSGAHLSLAPAPYCCSQRQDDVTGATSRCWCQARLPKAQRRSPCGACCPCQTSLRHRLCPRGAGCGVIWGRLPDARLLSSLSLSALKSLSFQKAAANVDCTPPSGGNEVFLHSFFLRRNLICSFFLEQIAERIGKQWRRTAESMIPRCSPEHFGVSRRAGDAAQDQSWWMVQCCCCHGNSEKKSSTI